MLRFLSDTFSRNMIRLLIALSFFPVLATATAAEPIDIGSRRELLVDRHLIERLDGARLALHRPQPREVAIRFDKPWESFSPGYTTVVHDEENGLYRMYYRSTLTPPAFGRNGTIRDARSPAMRKAGMGSTGLDHRWGSSNLRARKITTSCGTASARIISA